MSFHHSTAFALLASVAAAACASDGAPSAPEGAAPVAVAPLPSDGAAPDVDALVEEFDVTFTPGKGLEFERAPTAGGPSTLPQGFRQDPTSHFTFETAPNTDRAGPNGVFGDCGARQVCAQVGIGATTAFAGDTFPDVWARLVNLDLGVTVANGDVPPNGAASVLLEALNGIDGRPLAGLYTYGVLPDGGAPLLAAKRWNFNLPAGFNENTQIFKFRVAVVASFHHAAAIGYSRIDIPGQAVDACAGGTVLLSSGNQVTATTALPWVAHVFKFSSYAPDTGVNTPVWVSENGTFGIGAPFSSEVNGRLGLFPFGLTRAGIAVYWQDLVFGAAGQVCARVQGAHPSRTMTITWKNMELVSGAPTGKTITFSGILAESTDLIEFHYNQPSVIDSQTRGVLATVGIQASDPPGAAGAARQLANKSATFLPLLPASYPFGTSVVPN